MKVREPDSLDFDVYACRLNLIFNDFEIRCRENAKTKCESKNTRQMSANPTGCAFAGLCRKVFNARCERYGKALKASRVRTFNRKMGLLRINTPAKFPYHKLLRTAMRISIPHHLREKYD